MVLVVAAGVDEAAEEGVEDDRRVSKKRGRTWTPLEKRVTRILREAGEEEVVVEAVAVVDEAGVVPIADVVGELRQLPLRRSERTMALRAKGRAEEVTLF